jgi:hypothetical protein
MVSTAQIAQKVGRPSPLLFLLFFIPPVWPAFWHNQAQGPFITSFPFPFLDSRFSKLVFAHIPAPNLYGASQNESKKKKLARIPKSQKMPFYWPNIFFLKNQKFYCSFENCRKHFGSH